MWSAQGYLLVTQVDSYAALVHAQPVDEADAVLQPGRHQDAGTCTCTLMHALGGMGNWHWHGHVVLCHVVLCHVVISHCHGQVMPWLDIRNNFISRCVTVDCCVVLCCVVFLWTISLQ
jgi:hypothetical protein